MTTPEFSTCDLCDVHKNDSSGAFRVLPPVFRDFGARRRFAGPVVTIKCFEDNSLVKAVVDEPGRQRVLVVDAGGSRRPAPAGRNLAPAPARAPRGGGRPPGLARAPGREALPQGRVPRPAPVP